MTPVQERFAALWSPEAHARSRVAVEAAYFLALARERAVPLSLTKAEEDIAARSAALTDAQARDLASSHAYVAYLEERFRTTTLSGKTEWIHCGARDAECEDIVAGLMLRDAARLLAEPLTSVRQHLARLVARYDTLPVVLERSDTTEILTWGTYLASFLEEVKAVEGPLLHASFAVPWYGGGTYDALAYAFPKTDWPRFAERFIAAFNDADAGTLVLGRAREGWAAHMQALARSAYILQSLVAMLRDMSWRGYLAPFSFPASYDTSLRRVGARGEELARECALREPLSSPVDAYADLYAGAEGVAALIGSLSVREDAMRASVATAFSLVLDAIEAVLRREGQREALATFKERTHAHTISPEELRAFIKGLIIDEPTKLALLALSPDTYPWKG